MKKIYLVASVLMTSIAICILADNQGLSEGTENTDLTMASIEALTREEDGKNYGPVDLIECKYGGHRKICLCEPDFPECTETSCF